MRELIALVIIFCVLGGVISIPIAGVAYYSSCQSARVYNKMHSTDWTCWDFMWAGDQINQQTQTIKLETK